MSQGLTDDGPDHSLDKVNQTTPESDPASAEYKPAISSTFQYDSLDHGMDSIRLIQILPGADGDVIRCTMRHTTISESSYICLSYTWELEFPKHDIEVNGHSLSIGENLYQFLHAYRAFPVRKSPIDYSRLKYKRTLAPSLWIDAICIHQSDSTEKNHQVRQMSQIYTDADHILIWLGQLEDCDHLFRDLNNAYNSRSPIVPLEEKERLENELVAFYNSPYWSRLWVVQEILVACGSTLRKLAIFSGQQLIDFDSLYIAISKTTGKMGRSAINYLTNSQYHRYGRHSLFRTKPRGDFVVPSPLKDLLVAFPQDCRDKRDRIFALLSVSSDTSMIDVNYQLTKGQLFRHVFSQYIPGMFLKDCVYFGAILVESLELGDPSAGWGSSDLSSSSPDMSNVSASTWSHDCLWIDRDEITSHFLESSKMEVDWVRFKFSKGGQSYSLGYAVETVATGVRVRYIRLYLCVEGKKFEHASWRGDLRYHKQRSWHMVRHAPEWLRSISEDSGGTDDDTVVGHEFEIGADSDADSDAVSDADPDAESDAHSDAQFDGESGSGSDADADVDANLDFDLDINVHSDVESTPQAT